MKRYLDIENNIITFIEDYNRNYCTSSHTTNRKEIRRPGANIRHTTVSIYPSATLYYQRYQN